MVRMYLFSYAHSYRCTKNSTKRLHISPKAALKMHDLNTFTTSKHKKVVRNVKKVVSIRWLSLQASVDGVCDEYVRLLET